MHTCVCGGAGQQPNAPTASAAASEASSAPDAVEQTAETPVEGKSSIPTSQLALGKGVGGCIGQDLWEGGGACVLVH